MVSTMVSKTKNLGSSPNSSAKYICYLTIFKKYIIIYIENKKRAIQQIFILPFKGLTNNTKIK